MGFKISLLFQLGTGAAAGGPQTFSHLGGWSESVYYPGTDIAPVNQYLYLNGAWGAGLCEARAQLLPISASIIGQRIAKVFPTSGRSQTNKRGYAGGSGYLTDVPQMAIQCTAPAVGKINIRRFSLRGIPDGEVTYGELIPGAGQPAGINNYFNSLSNFYFVGQDFDQPVYPVSGVTAGGILTTVGANALAVGMFVSVKKTKDPTGVSFNAGRKILAVGPGVNQVTLDNWGVGDSTGGTVQNLTYLFMQINGGLANVDRVVVRKVGRPFEQYRGRRSKRKVR